MEIFNLSDLKAVICSKLVLRLARSEAVRRDDTRVKVVGCHRFQGMLRSCLQHHVGAEVVGETARRSRASGNNKTAYLNIKLPTFF